MTGVAARMRRWYTLPAGYSREKDDRA